MLGRELQELTSKLNRIYDNDQRLVTHILSLVEEYEDDVKELLNFINNDSDISRISVVTCACEINNWRMENAEDLLPYEEKAQELATELRRIFNDESKAILCVLSCVIDYEEDVDELLFFIKHDSDVDEDSVIACGTEIRDRRGEE